MNIIGIGIGISICVLVKPDEGIINPLIALESHPSDPELRQFRPAAASVGSFLPLQKGKSDAAAANTVPLRDDVRERAEKTLAERSAAAPEQGDIFAIYQIKGGPETRD